MAQNNTWREKMTVANNESQELTKVNPIPGYLTIPQHLDEWIETYKQSDVFLYVLKQHLESAMLKIKKALNEFER